ncbi:MAG: undecaprenyl-phosphate glucose phosphotransferase [bacterium]
MLKNGLLKEYASIINIFIRIVDLLMITLSALIVYRLEFYSWKVAYEYQIAVIICLLLTIAIFPLFKLYQSWRGQEGFSIKRTITGAWFVVVLTMFSIAYLTKTEAFISREWFLIWTVISWISLISIRSFVFRTMAYIRSRGLNLRHIILLGAGDLGRHVIESMSNNPWTGFNIRVLLDDDPEKQGRYIAGKKVDGVISEIGEFIKELNPDEIWIALPLSAEKRLHEILRMLQYFPVNIRLIPDIYDLQLINHSVTEVSGISFINISESPMKGINFILKWIEDKILSLLILGIISPFMLLIALLVKLSSPGPILYRQERVGWNGKTFQMYKFRTMPVDTEKNGITWGAKNKPNTRLGAFLRRTSLDELPQFFNVLLGKMSVVGPRPERPMFVDKFKNEIDGYMQKHLVKAGITGWAQVNGFRGDTDLRKRIEYDLYYIKRWSLWFDLRIIFLTILNGFINKNAY